jgi:coatomer subunit beta'
LFYSSYGDQEGLNKLAENAELNGKYNVAFEAAFLTADVNRCLNVLLKSKRMGEAAFFAKAYAPSRVNEVTKVWSDYLKE